MQYPSAVSPLATLSALTPFTCVARKGGRLECDYRVSVVGCMAKSNYDHASEPLAKRMRGAPSPTKADGRTGQKEEWYCVLHGWQRNNAAE